MFTRIGSVLKTTPHRSKSTEPLLALKIRQAAKEVLDKVLASYPEELVKKVKVKTFKNGVLTITSPTLLAAELNTRSEGLKGDINRALNKNIIEKIRYRKA